MAMLQHIGGFGESVVVSAGVEGRRGAMTQGRYANGDALTITLSPGGEGIIKSALALPGKGF